MDKTQLNWIKPVKTKEFILESLEGKSLEYKFHKSIEYNQLWLVKECIQNGINPAINNDWAIRTSALNGFTKIVKFLLKDIRVNPSVMNNSPIIFAASNGHLHTMNELFMDPRVDPSDNDNKAFIKALENEHAGIVMTLLKDIRVKNKLTPKMKYDMGELFTSKIKF